jgi:hypothetical protein
MPWLISETFVEAMLEVAAWADPTITGWWRDELKVQEWWDALDLPAACDVGVAAFPDGGMVAWIGKQAGKMDDDALWTLYAIAPNDGRNWIPQEELFSKGETKWPETWITKWRAWDRVEKKPDDPASVGDWVACCVKATMEGRLGIACQVDAAGRVLTVKLGDHRPEVDVREVGGRFFKLNERDLALNWYWARGQTEFKHYRNMLGQLAGKQKKLAGKAMPPVKRSTPPIARQKLAGGPVASPEPADTRVRTKAFAALHEAFSAMPLPEGVEEADRPFWVTDQIIKILPPSGWYEKT